MKRSIDRHYRKKKLITKHVTNIVTGSSCPIFVTLTFNDSYINSSKHRKYVRDFLKSQNINFICNVDYGSKNGRKHYHAICSNLITPSDWSYGSCNVKRINKNVDLSKLASYICKLSLHGVKLTTISSESIISYFKN